MGKARSNAWRNVANFLDVPAFEQQVLVGRDSSQTAEDAAKYGWAESTTDWRSVIAREDIDLVDLCAPEGMNAEIATAALEAGKHVLMANPFSDTLAEMELMTAAAVNAHTRGVRSMTGFNYGHLPALTLARELIAEGRIGAVRHIRAVYVRDTIHDARDPRPRHGILGDIICHAIDQVHYVAGERIMEATGTLRASTMEHTAHCVREVTDADTVWATLGMSGKVGASIEASTATGQKNNFRIEIYGTAGTLTLDLENLNELVLSDATATVPNQSFHRILVSETDASSMDVWWPQGDIIGWEYTFTRQIRDFLLAVRSGVDARPSFEDGLQLRLVLAAIDASAKNRSNIIPIHHPSQHPIGA